jgi:biopolymer transport protein ExbB
MSQKKSGSNLHGMLAAIVIPAAYILCLLIFKFILGNPANFQDNNPELNPLPGNMLGIIYKGGFIVPILMSLLVIVITFVIERFITVNKSKGNGSVDAFVHKMRSSLSNGDVDGAIKECDRQTGSIAAVVKSGLNAYKQMASEKVLDKEHKIATIQKEIEEATTLELPMLSKNLIIISTIASIATLMGLLGTVIGMIRAFAALAQAGSPDATALATGISEALINTGLGIGTSAIAIIFYNFFTNKIDSITYGIDEAGYSIVQSFTARH